MADGPNPRKWPEVPDWVLWGGLAFSCFLVVVESAVKLEWAQAFAALVAGIVVVAVALHWKQFPAGWAVPVVITTILVIALSPYVEAGRWPYAWMLVESKSPVAQGAASDAALEQLRQTDDQTIRSLQDQLGIAHMHISAQCAFFLSTQYLAEGSLVGVQPRTIVVITSTNGTQGLRDDIEVLLRRALGDPRYGTKEPPLNSQAPIALAQPPDYDTYPQAPRIETRKTPGITIHGSGQGAEFFRNALQGVLSPHQVVPWENDKMLRYYQEEGALPNYGAVIWIDIGPPLPGTNRYAGALGC